MDWEPYTGRRVVCINDNWMDRLGETFPERGCVYTIRSAAPGVGGIFLRFFEIVNAPQVYIQGADECDFAACCFRPVVDRRVDISALVHATPPSCAADRVT